MQFISEHELKDIVRVEAGVLIEIHKYEHQKGLVWIPDCRKHLKKVSGLKNGYIAKEDFIYNNMKISKGEYILDNFKAIPLVDKSLFRIELKCSGGSIRKSFKQMNELMNNIMEYINTNY